MNKTAIGISLSFLLVLLVASCSDRGQESATEAAKQLLTKEELGGYAHGLEVGDMRFLWKAQQESIDIKLAAKTTGWVGIGFNPDMSEDMKGANFIIGYVKDGKAEAFDHYGIMEGKHREDEKIGGTADFSDLSGSETNGTTELAFSLPLDTRDSVDTVLNLASENTVLLAYGRSDSIVLKHRFRAVLRVNLSTGEQRVIKIK
ncbi:DOMON domain-containing protein [bacterium]|nr:DOMON domain-containing protein [bacterium]